LLGAACPLQIAGFVTAVVVDAILAKTVRRIAPIGVPIFKAQVVFADGDGSVFATSVIVIGGVVRVKTARDHAFPSAVGTGFGHAVCRLALSLKFPLKASTAD
jgi:hypothetical protein